MFLVLTYWYGSIFIIVLIPTNSLQSCALIPSKDGSEKGKEIICYKYYIYTSLFCFFQVWINSGDIILLGLRDYQDAKADVILKYTPDEARNLKTYGELPESGMWRTV
jgi:hypothetical protein